MISLLAILLENHSSPTIAGKKILAAPFREITHYSWVTANIDIAANL